MTDCLLWLAEFDSPLDAVWAESETGRFSDSERNRLARIGRTLRREQFVVGHVLLRRLLAAHGVAEAVVEVGFDGRPRLAGETPWHVSLAHCDRTVVALLATAAAGVDIERARPPRDPAALGAFLGDRHADPASALERWVVAEARIKCGVGDASAWIAQRDDVLIAVAGARDVPALWTHDLTSVTYNRIAQKWTAVP